MSVYYRDIDKGDNTVGTLHFYAEPIGDAGKYKYQWAITLPSTVVYGLPGRVGDGDDFILDEGIKEGLPEDFDWEAFAEDECPAIPNAIDEEIELDRDLCELSKLLYREMNAGHIHSFADLLVEYDSREGTDLLFDHDKILAYADAHGWAFEFDQE